MVLLTNIFTSMLAIMLYHSLFLLGKRSLKKMATTVCPTQNSFYSTSLEQATAVSQPSLLHQYFMLEMDIPRGCELVIKAVVNHSYQSYWSVVIYDEVGREGGVCRDMGGGGRRVGVCVCVCISVCKFMEI